MNINESNLSTNPGHKGNSKENVYPGEQLNTKYQFQISKALQSMKERTLNLAMMRTYKYNFQLHLKKENPMMYEAPKSVYLQFPLNPLEENPGTSMYGGLRDFQFITITS